MGAFHPAFGGEESAGLTPEQTAKLETLGQRYVKSADPTVNDDSGEGYAVWDKWLNTTSSEAYVCLDADDLSDLFGGKISHDLATAESDFLVGAPTPFGTFVKKTLAEVKTILAWVLASTAEAVGFTISGGTTSKTLTVTESTTLGGGSHSGSNTGDNPGVTAVSGTAPLASSGGATPAISLVNNAGTPADITAVDVGALADSDTSVPTSKAVRTVTSTKADKLILETAEKTNDYTLADGDQDKIVLMNKTGAATLTVPTNATFAFTIGTVIGVYNVSADAVTIAGAGGVDVRNAGDLAQYGEVSLRKRAADEWVLAGSVT